MSRKTLLQIARSILIFNGLATSLAGLLFMIDPSGTLMGMSTTQLLFLPFKNFFFPGLALSLTVGTSSLLIAVLVGRNKGYRFLSMLSQGIITLLWVIVESFTIPDFSSGILFGTTSVLLIALAFIVRGEKSISGFGA